MGSSRSNKINLRIARIADSFAQRRHGSARIIGRKRHSVVPLYLFSNFADIACQCDIVISLLVSKPVS